MSLLKSVSLTILCFVPSCLRTVCYVKSGSQSGTWTHHSANSQYLATTYIYLMTCIEMWSQSIIQTQLGFASFIPNKHMFSGFVWPCGHCCQHQFSVDDWLSNLVRSYVVESLTAHLTFLIYRLRDQSSVSLGLGHECLVCYSHCQSVRL